MLQAAASLSKGQSSPGRLSWALKRCSSVYGSSAGSSLGTPRPSRTGPAVFRRRSGTRECSAEPARVRSSEAAEDYPSQRTFRGGQLTFPRFSQQNRRKTRGARRPAWHLKVTPLFCWKFSFFLVLPRPWFSVGRVLPRRTKRPCVVPQRPLFIYEPSWQQSQQTDVRSTSSWSWTGSRQESARPLKLQRGKTRTKKKNTQKVQQVNPSLFSFTFKRISWHHVISNKLLSETPSLTDNLKIHLGKRNIKKKNLLRLFSKSRRKRKGSI